MKRTHICDDLCPRCEKATVQVERYKHGADADGNRYEWREDVECLSCGWTPADGYEFDRCEECGMVRDDCDCCVYEYDELQINQYLEERGLME